MNYSKQRALVLNTVINSYEHPTADMVYKEVKKDIPNISLGTVYRNLNLLVELGKIKRIVMPNGSDRFDKIVSKHYHFCCNKCDRIFDITSNELKDLKKRITIDTGYRVYYYDVVFIGECSNCISLK